MKTPVIAFHIVFRQDIAVLQPLMILAKTIPGKRLELLVSEALKTWDPDGSWTAEVEKLSSDLNIPITYYGSPEQACRCLEGKSGLFIVGNESSVPPHHLTHDLFKVLPSSFVKVTMQHGLECVGFLHNAAYEALYGCDVRFAADIVVGWFAKRRLTDMHPTEQAKLYVAGPPIMIAPRPPRTRSDRKAATLGLVCENLHSARFTAHAVDESFLGQFFAFAEHARSLNGRIALRPHPAGRFTQQKGLKLPPGTEWNTEPLYQQNLGEFDFGISPPSSILLDLVVANVPAAVWVDPGGHVDARNFAGLEIVSSAAEWRSFAARAHGERDIILANQDRFLEDLGIPSDVAARYAKLMAQAA